MTGVQQNGWSPINKACLRNTKLWKILHSSVFMTAKNPELMIRNINLCFIPERMSILAPEIGLK